MIDKLTPEQEARFPEFVERGVRMGLCTDPIDPLEARDFTVWLYTEVLKRPVPKTVIVRGPLELHTGGMFFGLKEQKEPVPEFKELENGQEIVDVPASRWQEIWNQIKDKVEGVHFVWPYLDGQFWASWFAFYDFMREVLKIELPANYDQLRKLVNLGMVYPLDEACLIAQRMSICKRNAQNQLHCDGGPAVEFADGFKLWALNGVRVPQWLAETDAMKIDCHQFSKVDNAEVRREFIRKVGAERVMQQVGAEVIDRQGDEYELVVVDLKGETGKWPYLKMLNPSIGVWHMEAVGKECQTVKDALKWRNQSELAPEQLT